ncbi:MAG TPA: hypothetical protein VGL92_08390 [Acidimicrobiia bacterium]
MSDIPTAVITGFVSAFTMFLAVVAFTGRQVRDVKSELKADIGEVRADLHGLRSELKADIGRLDDKFERLMFELLRHFREGGHPPPPQAA